MKPLKRANQQNILINEAYYTERQIKELLETKEIFYFDKNLNTNYDFNAWYFGEERKPLRIFVSNVKEIKVKLDDYGYYTNVVVGNNGKEYFISL